jgi:hypothetical protein
MSLLIGGNTVRADFHQAHLAPETLVLVSNLSSREEGGGLHPTAEFAHLPSVFGSTVTINLQGRMLTCRDWTFG